MKSFVVLLCVFCFVPVSMDAQNSVAVTDINMVQIQDGYTLLYPQRQSNLYLINNCGQVVHEWQDNSIYYPGLSAYLLKNGDLLKTKRINQPIDTSFSGNGAGGIVELRSWDNQLKWSKEFANGTYRAHHDVEMMPNGNVLVIAWKRRTRDEYIQAGGDTTLFDREEIWPDVIMEYNPILDSVVWEWDSWDHVVQDFDDQKDNFGNVQDTKGKIDLNYDVGGVGGRPDWLHFNAVDYNAELDQIVISASYFNELWIIDHSCSAEEVKGDTGGNFGKGGQLLYRWGNPITYKSGTSEDQKLFFQHDVQWLDGPEISESEYFQQIGVFNNRSGTLQSSMSIISPELDLNTNTYVLNGETYFPEDFEKSIFSTFELDFYSSNMSSMQLLGNGNFLACASQTGTIYEITPENEIAWRYKLPMRNGFRIEQGSQLFTGENVMFRAKKFGNTFKAFEGKTLDPMYYLELEPNIEFCDLSLNILEVSDDNVSIYPNPTSNVLHISTQGYKIKNIEVIDHLGRSIFLYLDINQEFYHLDVDKFVSGLYYIRINNSDTFKFVVER